MVSRLIFLHFWVNFFFIYDWYLFICSTFHKLFCMPYIFANLDLGSAEFRLKFLSISLSFISSSSSGTCNTQNSFSETIASFSQYHTQAACLRDRRAVKITAKNHLSPILKKKTKTLFPYQTMHFIYHQLINGKNLDRIKYALSYF